jgi:plastocyanin
MRCLRLLLLICCTLLAGCGGGDGGGGGGTSRPVTVKTGQTLKLVGDEYAFHPSRVVVVGAGELEFELDNQGSLAHNLSLRRGGSQLTAVSTIKGGEIGTGTLALAPGRYELICTVGDHAKLGMKGTLQVR